MQKASVEQFLNLKLYIHLKSIIILIAYANIALDDMSHPQGLSTYELSL